MKVKTCGGGFVIWIENREKFVVCVTEFAGDNRNEKVSESEGNA